MKFTGKNHVQSTILLLTQKYEKIVNESGMQMFKVEKSDLIPTSYFKDEETGIQKVL